MRKIDLDIKVTPCQPDPDEIKDNFDYGIVPVRQDIDYDPKNVKKIDATISYDSTTDTYKAEFHSDEAFYAFIGCQRKNRL